MPRAGGVVIATDVGDKLRLWTVIRGVGGRQRGAVLTRATTVDRGRGDRVHLVNRAPPELAIVKPTRTAVASLGISGSIGGLFVDVRH